MATLTRATLLVEREHVLEVDVPDAVAELLERTRSVVALRPPPAGVDGRAEPVASGCDLLAHLLRRPLRMVLDPEPDVVPLEHRRELPHVAREAAADQGGAQRQRELARPVDVARAEPRRVGGD
jgi:hypothetical protein